MPKKGESGGAGSQYYRSYLERPGPQNLGSVDWPKPKRGALKGQRFLATGILETIKREDLYKLIEGCGGKVKTAVSKKLNYLIVGRDAGPAKLEKAKEMEISQIDESGFHKFITKALKSYDEKDGEKNNEDDEEDYEKDDQKDDEKDDKPKTRKG